MPVSANEIFFVATETEADDDDKEPLYYPLGTAGTTYYPVFCPYSDGQPSRVYNFGSHNAERYPFPSRNIPNIFNDGRGPHE